MTTATARIAGHIAGTWDIDGTHSNISFLVRHMMLSRLRGQFRTFSGEIVTTPVITDTTVKATVDMASFDTNNEQRDSHVRSSEFLDVAVYPLMSFQSTAVEMNGENCVLTGDLTIKGITGQVAFDVEVVGIGPDAFGGTRAGFSGRGQISRKAFGVDVDVPMPGGGGGVVIGDKITLALEIEAVLRTE